ncbi:MAG: hypothetical protein HUK22_08080, partial [Thermoguttaceae bacterium]|nr:hypothetical protein [Thermoguttaceae bacterium]
AFIYLAIGRFVKTQIFLCALILIGYWLTIALVPALDVRPASEFTKEAFVARAQNLLTPQNSPSIQENFSIGGGFCGYVDRQFVPGKLYTGIEAMTDAQRDALDDETREFIEKKGLHDPEGLFSTLPAIVTALLGMIFGGVLLGPQIPPKKREDENGEEKANAAPAPTSDGYRKVAILLGWGLALVIIGVVWHQFFPINKKIWNSSFVCAVGGYSAMILGIFYLIIDVWGEKMPKFLSAITIRWWAFIFAVVGMNPITIYVARRILGFNVARDFFFGDVVEKFIPELWQPAALTFASLIVSWVFLWVLYKKRAFFRV